MCSSRTRVARAQAMQNPCVQTDPGPKKGSGGKKNGGLGRQRQTQTHLHRSSCLTQRACGRHQQSKQTPPAFGCIRASPKWCVFRCFCVWTDVARGSRSACSPSGRCPVDRALTRGCEWPTASRWTRAWSRLCRPMATASAGTFADPRESSFSCFSPQKKRRDAALAGRTTRRTWGTRATTSSLT